MKTWSLRWEAWNDNGRPTGEAVNLTVQASTYRVALIKARRELNKTHANQLGKWTR